METNQATILSEGYRQWNLYSLFENEWRRTRKHLGSVLSLLYIGSEASNADFIKFMIQAIDSLVGSQCISPSISQETTPITSLAFRLLSQHFSSTFTNQASRNTMWRTITDAFQKQLSSVVLLRFITAMENGSFPRNVDSAQLDDEVLLVASRVLDSGDEIDLSVTEKLVCQPRSFFLSRLELSMND
jgi:hypothetical protein